MDPIDKKSKRRTRHDQNNRDYKCGCGSSYLSYPALYTHLKQKHDGKKPLGTQMPPISGHGKRGRPRNEDDGEGREEEKERIDEEERDEGTESVDRDRQREGQKKGKEELDESVISDDGLDEFLFYLQNKVRNLKNVSTLILYPTPSSTFFLSSILHQSLLPSDLTLLYDSFPSLQPFFFIFHITNIEG